MRDPTCVCSSSRCYEGSEAIPTGPVDLRDCASFGGEIAREGPNPYGFGVDPVWRGTKTELPYLNSLKMKMSIIIGVTHMNLGILMSLFNNNYFRCAWVPGRQEGLLAPLQLDHQRSLKLHASYYYLCEPVVSLPCPDMCTSSSYRLCVLGTPCPPGASLCPR